MASPDGTIPALDLCEGPVLEIETLFLIPRISTLVLASQVAPGILPLKKDANAGIEPTIIAT